MRVGERYGLLTVRALRAGRRGLAVAECECGGEWSGIRQSLKSGSTQSCGCLRVGVKPESLLEQVFGNVVVTDGPDKRGSLLFWFCQCICGRAFWTSRQNLKAGKTTSCGCRGRWPGETQARCLFAQYRKSAKKRGYTFRISFADFLKITQRNCYYCGGNPAALAHSSKGKTVYRYNGLDRVHNRRGYTLNNVVPCCKTCNYAKRDSPLAQFENWLDGLVAFRSNRCVV